MKGLFYTDCHISGKTPRHRIDNYQESIVNKIRETYEIADSTGCSFVGFGGDFFNTHRIFSYELISDIMDIICKSKIKTYMCLGEHDLYGHSPTTYKSSTLAFFVRHCSNVEILWEPKDLGEIVLYGKHEFQTMDEAMSVKVDKRKYSILLCHELLSATKHPFDIIDVHTLTGCPYDLVLSGDLHCGYNITEVDGTIFANPGSLARQTTADAGRMPQVVLFDIDVKTGKTEVEYRKLKCAQPGEEVFGEDLVDLLREEKNGVSTSAFAEGLLELEAESADVYELIAKAGAAAKLEKQVVDYLASKRGDEI